VCDGKIAKSLPLDGKRDSADIEGTLPISASGWCLLRAWSEKAEYPVMDNYAYATTGPIYVNVADKKPRSPEDAKYLPRGFSARSKSLKNIPIGIRRRRKGP